MKIAFLTDPLSQFKPYKDSTYAMMVEATKRGHTVYAFGPQDLALINNNVVASMQEVKLTGTGEEKTWFQLGGKKEFSLHELDAILQRKDPPFDMEYIYATYLLEKAEKKGARVFNKPSAIRDHNEKLAITEFSEFITPTLVTRSEERIRDFFNKHQDIILKPLDGMGGVGIFRIRADGMNLGSVIETLTMNGSQTIMVQKFIPEIVDGDKRILLIGGEVVPFSLARIPQNGEVRGNLAAGGRGVAQELTEHDYKIAHTLAPILHQRGLLLVGLDVIGNCLTEVNVTSPTCFQEIYQQKGFDVAKLFIDSLEKNILISSI
jgi:glutathione synthase